MATNNAGIDWMGSLGVGVVDFDNPLSTVPEQHQGTSGMNQYEHMDRISSATLKVYFISFCLFCLQLTSTYFCFREILKWNCRKTIYLNLLLTLKLNFKLEILQLQHLR